MYRVAIGILPVIGYLLAPQIENVGLFKKNVGDFLKNVGDFWKNVGVFLEKVQRFFLKAPTVYRTPFDFWSKP